MLVALVGFAGGMIYGTADFLGGLASKRVHPAFAAGLAAASGLVLLLIALPIAGGRWTAEAVIWGALSGVSGSIALALLYACLAIGPMSILSPLTAVVSALVPMTAGLLRGEAFGAIGYAGLGLALLAVVLVGFVPEKGAVRPSARGLIMAVASGALIGGFLILIDSAPDDSGLLPLVANRGVSMAMMAIAVIAIALVARLRGRSSGAALTRGAPRGERRAAIRYALVFALSCGVVDATANTLLLAGVRLGDLSVVSVLTALYPAGTIILAAVVLKERIAPVQIAGLVLAVAAAAMLAVA